MCLLCHMAFALQYRYRYQYVRLYILGIRWDDGQKRPQEESFQNTARTMTCLTMKDLPDSILLSIFCYTHLDHINCLRGINKKFNDLICSKEFFLARKANGVAEEMLFFAGGTYPVRMTKRSKKASGDMLNSRRWNNRIDNQFRYALEENPHGVIRGYIPLLKEWRIFGSTEASNAASAKSGDYLERHLAEYRTVFIPYLYSLIYLGGRYLQDEFGECSDQVWAYSFLTNRFEQWPPMLSRRCKAMFQAALVGNHIVVAGSNPEEVDCCPKIYPRNSRCLGRQCEKFDLQSQKWSTIADIPYHQDGYGGAAAIDDRFLFLPGCDAENGEDEGNYIHVPIADDSSSNAMVPFHSPGLVYDLENDRWSFIPKQKGNAGMQASTIVYNGKVLVIGGFHSNQAVHYNGRIVDYEDHLDDVKAFDPYAGAWLDNCKIPNLPVAVRGASTCIHNGKLTLLGGLSSFSSAFHSEESQTIWQLHEDGEASEWKKVGSINLPLSALLDGFAFSVWL